ncbi:MAG TPA: extracellular solute-binding protein [Planctomycetota bacterium]|jgi:raffinose/stachyose/melibiose transport system substrate-binding protein
MSESERRRGSVRGSTGLRGSAGLRAGVSRAWNRLSDRVSGRYNTRRRLSDTEKRSIWEKRANRFAMVLLLGTFVLSFGDVLLRTKKASGQGQEILTLAHWQLEPGVRSGLELAAKKYNEMRRQKGLPEIVFKQLPIAERGYPQWVTTQLMGGTAPDLIEMGMGLSIPVWITYRARYFVPVTQEILKPNPYNKGFQFEVGGKRVAGESAPWKETYVDSMGVPVRELQEYYDVGLSTFSCRMFYNRELLKKLTGRLAASGKWPRQIEEPPEDLREFLKLCDAMSELKDDQGQPYMPLAGSAYQSNILVTNMVEPLTGAMMEKIDDNIDGTPTNDETFLGFLLSRLKFEDPTMLKIMGLQREITKRFQPGWRGLNRDDAVGLFIQQRCVFIASGSWDGMTLKAQAESAPKRFEVFIAPFPMLFPNDPEWGDIAFGRVYDKPTMGFSFGLTKVSKHPELALDFLRFATSQKVNEEMNAEIGWIPAIKGAKPSPYLAAFTPNFDGPRKGLEPIMGGRSDIVYQQVQALLLLNQDEKGQPFSVQDWAKRMRAEWIPAAMSDFEQRDETERDALKSKEALAAILRAKLIMCKASQKPAETGTGSQQLTEAARGTLSASECYQSMYADYVVMVVDAPRVIARWQLQLAEARQKGLVK